MTRWADEDSMKYNMDYVSELWMLQQSKRSLGWSLGIPFEREFWDKDYRGQIEITSQWYDDFRLAEINS